MRTVAALYVDPRGPYPKLADVDCWDEQRDARGYDGPHTPLLELSAQGRRRTPPAFAEFLVAIARASAR